MAKKASEGAKKTKSGAATAKTAASKKAQTAKKGKSTGDAKSTRKPASSSGTAREKTKLVTEISALLKKMDQESLAFMKRQAEVIVSAKEYNEIRKKTMEALSHLEAGQRAEYAADDVTVERKDESFFNIIVRGNRVFFNIDELRALTRLCHAAGTASEGARRLLTWFRRERDDFLKDCSIQSAADPALAKLHQVIVTTYKVRS